MHIPERLQHSKMAIGIQVPTNALWLEPSKFQVTRLLLVHNPSLVECTLHPWRIRKIHTNPHVQVYVSRIPMVVVDVWGSNLIVAEVKAKQLEIPQQAHFIIWWIVDGNIIDNQHVYHIIYMYMYVCIYIYIIIINRISLVINLDSSGG